MIPSNQLRVGNYVLFQGEYCTVSAIFDIDTNEDKYPIPLTKEILEACGFVRERRMFYKGIYFIALIGHNCGFGVRNVTGIIATLKYLHQLQNIYFALTGEELQITINTCNPAAGKISVGIIQIKSNESSRKSKRIN